MWAFALKLAQNPLLATAQTMNAFETMFLAYDVKDRLINVELAPFQIAGFRHAKPMTIHQRDKRLIARAIAALPCCLDKLIDFGRYQMLPHTGAAKQLIAFGQLA